MNTDGRRDEVGEPTENVLIVRTVGINQIRPGIHTPVF